MGNNHNPRTTDTPEFPGFVNVYESRGEAEFADDNPAEAGLSRRRFLALSAAFGASLAGCRRPDLEIIPFSVIPDDQIGHLAPGRPTFYATTFPRAGGSLPILVESHDGRPTKIEGNPQHPASGGATDVFSQASVFDLYSPDRVMSDKYPGVMEKGTPRRWEDFDRAARSLADKLSKSQGEGFAILTDQVPSPALRLIREHVKSALPKASWHTYEPVDQSESLKGAAIAFGKPLVAKYDFAAIDRILALDSDFLGNDPDAMEYGRAFASRRQAVEIPVAIDKFTIILAVGEDGRANSLTDQLSDSEPLKTPGEIENHLRALARMEQLSTKQEKPTATVILRTNKTPEEKTAVIVEAIRKAGYEKIRVERSGETPEVPSIHTMNRLYVVESTYTVTGTMADHRLRLPASQIGGFLLAVARELKVAVPNLSAPGTAFPEKWVTAVAKDLSENKGKAAVIVGHRQPAWVHALTHAVNAHLGADKPRPERRVEGDVVIEGEWDAVVQLRPAPAEVTEKGTRELVADMAAGKVNTLLVVGGNPALDAPADLAFRRELQKVPTKIRLGLFHDHTSEACDWHLPLAHPLESWGDTETSDGTLCCIQPLIAPLNGSKPATAPDTEPPARGGRTALEVLALLTQFKNPDGGKKVDSYLSARKAAYAAVRKAFADRVNLDKGETPDLAFNRYKQLGFLPKPISRDPKGSAPTLNADAVAKSFTDHRSAPAPTKDSLEVTFHPDYRLLDGRFAMNPWLQELPDPITKLVWDNAAVVSPKTADEFGLRHGDVAKLTVNGVTLDIPVYILPGQADYSVALAYGQSGEMRINHVPNGGGTNVFPARTTKAMHTATGCKLEKTGRTFDLVMTQEHGVIPDGRDIIGEYKIADYAEKTGHGHESLSRDAERSAAPAIGVPPDGHVTERDIKQGFQGGYGNHPPPPQPATEKQLRFPLDLARPELLDSQFQWGMTIDLSACTGCSACLIACQAENNIPVVGKSEVKRNREMHWIRIDRYFSSDGHTADADPKIVTQPVACVHCEQAPCEQVCPVNAAVHSPEGLNLQVYNRCIGTRYCSNACPYKVRRFNWFDFNKRGLDELRTPTPFAREGASLTENLLPETLKMQKNPDVTVRMRGVMEKCTYCVQRIERGKYGAKIAAAEVANGRRTIEVDASFEPDGPATGYKKPKNPKAVGYDLDRQGRVIVPDGLIVTACQSACPTRAITFGNVLDPNSAVYKAKLRAGEYLLLAELNTKPRTSYLPRLRNPNPDLV
jgi:molybdopterin-containing oxidoreductase family iron-sulfur binding subunit